VSTVSIIGDSKLPVLEVTSPQAAGQATGKPKVTVTGTAKDDLSGLLSVEVAGQKVNPGLDGSFSLDLASVLHGLNILDWKAIDGAGNIATGQQSFYFSPTWFSLPTGSDYISIQGAAGLWLPQSLFDNGLVHNHAPPKNFAAAREIGLAKQDMLAALGANPIPINQALLLMTMKSLTVVSVDIGKKDLNDGNPLVSLAVTTSGAHCVVDLISVQATVRLNLESFGVIGWVEYLATMNVAKVDGDLHFIVNQQTNEVTHSISETKLKLGPWTVEIGKSNLPSPLDGWAKSGKNFLEGLVSSVLDASATPVISGFLVEDGLGTTAWGISALITAALPKKLTIAATPSDSGMSVTIGGAMSLSNLTFAPGKGATLVADALYGPQNAQPSLGLGSIGRGSCQVPGAPVLFSFPAPKPAIGLSDDAINALLFSSWRAGGLDGVVSPAELAAAAQVAGGKKWLTGTAKYLFPPIWTSCANGGTKLMLQIGDFQVNGTVEIGGAVVPVAGLIRLQGAVSLVVASSGGPSPAKSAVTQVELLGVTVTKCPGAAISDCHAAIVSLGATVAVQRATAGIDGVLANASGWKLDMSILTEAKNPEALATSLETTSNGGGASYFSSLLE
jgi:hypothetical protein